MITITARNEPGGGRAFFRELQRDFLSAQNPWAVRRPSEVFVICGIGHETIRFMHKAANRNSRHRYSFPLVPKITVPCSLSRGKALYREFICIFKVAVPGFTALD